MRRGACRRHAPSLILNAACAIAVFVLIRRLLLLAVPESANRQCALLLCALAGAAVFAVHPFSSDHFRTALAADPRNADAHNNWGVALAQLGRLDEAASHWQAALWLDPTQSEAAQNLVRARQMLAASSQPAASRP